jgi:hypothetical protein
VSSCNYCYIDNCQSQMDHILILMLYRILANDSEINQWSMSSSMGMPCTRRDSELSIRIIAVSLISYEKSNSQVNESPADLIMHRVSLQAYLVYPEANVNAIQLRIRISTCISKTRQYPRTAFPARRHALPKTVSTSGIRRSTKAWSAKRGKEQK